jgi:hypothetical protein
MITGLAITDLLERVAINDARPGRSAGETPEIPV